MSDGGWQDRTSERGSGREDELSKVTHTTMIICQCNAVCRFKEYADAVCGVKGRPCHFSLCTLSMPAGDPIAWRAIQLSRFLSSSPNTLSQAIAHQPPFIHSSKHDSHHQQPRCIPLIMPFPRKQEQSSVEEDVECSLVEWHKQVESEG